jgi:uncharacterized protein
MDIKKVEQVAYDYMADRKGHQEREPGWEYYHGHRAARIAVWLCGEMNFNIKLDTIYAGALFHDIGKGSEPHNEVGAAITKKSLKNLCTTDEMNTICDIIMNHNQRGQLPHFSEDILIVQDADVLDHVGPIGPWLTFYWTGMHNETFNDHIRFIEGDENAATQKRMREGLNYELSKRVFDERIDYEKHYFAQFKRVYLEGI